MRWPSTRSGCRDRLFGVVAVLSVIIGLIGPNEAHKKSQPHLLKEPWLRVNCSNEEMVVQVHLTPTVRKVYLEHLKHFSPSSCQPRSESGRMIFTLNLQDIYKCMITRVLDRETGRHVYYQRVVVEFNGDKPKKLFLAKCDSSVYLNREGNQTSYVIGSEEVQTSVVKRSANPQFPVNFEEPDYEIEITSEVTGKAPVPELFIGVKQEGRLIDDDLTVKPGTPLNMEIFLDNNSKDIYGLMVSNMDVTDQKEQEEILILNGCTVDPYLFENFLTDDGDLLRAKFKAFKFPESNYVLFRGVVNVCLDKCQGVDCANGNVGFGKRRRREVPETTKSINKVYEVSMSTILRIEDVEEKASSSSSITKRNPEAFQAHKAQVAESLHPDDVSVMAVSQDFGSYKFVEFDADLSSREKRNTAVTSSSLVQWPILAGILVLRMWLF